MTDAGGSDDPPAANSKKPNPWPDTPITDEHREAIAKEESGSKKYEATNGYGAKNGYALGRYQIGYSAQQDLGLRERGPAGKWNPNNKYGAKNEEAFLDDPVAQEKALADYTAINEGYLSKLVNGFRATDHIGKKIKVNNKEVTVTKNGLIAAAHRAGAGMVRAYLRHQARNNWTSDFGTLDPETAEHFGFIELRLQTFEKIPYRKQ